MAAIKTVKIKNPAAKGDFLSINEEDFVAGEHELFESAETEAKDETADLMKLTKGDLVAMAENADIDIVPDEMTKAQIVEKILAAE